MPEREQAVTIIEGERAENARTALAMWNNGRGQYDSAWVLRRAFELAQALRDMIYAYDRLMVAVTLGSGGEVEYECGHRSNVLEDTCAHSEHKPSDLDSRPSGG